MKRRASLRRRLDTWGLRVQARLDAEWADRSLPWALAVVLFALLLAMSLAVVRQLDGGPGLAVWTQAAWNVRHGGGPVSSIAQSNVVTDQWSFVAYPVLWLSHFAPAAQVFAATQAFALSLTVVPLWRLARTAFALRVGTTVAVIAAFALAPAVHAVNLSLFHPEVVAIPALAWCALLRRQDHWIRYFACIAVVLACRADLGLAVAAVGLVALLDGDRWRALVTIVVGAAWTVAAVVVLDPRLPADRVTAGRAFAEQGPAALAEARRIVLHPATVIGHLTGQQSVVIIVALFAPLLFLGFAAPRTLIPAIPIFVLGIGAGQSLQALTEPGIGRGGLGAGRVVVAVIPITVAALVALSRIGQRSVSRVNVDHRLVGAMAIASVLLFVQYAPSSPYQHPWAWGSRDDTDMARLAAVDSLPDRMSVTVTPQLSALVASRRYVAETWIGPPTSPDSWEPTTDAVILDTTGSDDTGTSLWNEDDRSEIVADLEAHGYRELTRSKGILTFRR